MSVSTSSFYDLEDTGITVFEKLDGASVVPVMNLMDPYANLTIVKRTESRAEDIAHAPNEFTLGITLSKIRPSFYLTISGTPELTQRGYFLLNGPLLVNPGEEIRVTLYKFDENAADLILPFTDGLIMFCNRKFVCNFTFPAMNPRIDNSKKSGQQNRRNRKLENEDTMW